MDNSTFFQNLYRDLPLPVIVCANNPSLPIVYMNVRAGIMFSPSHSTQSILSQNPLGQLVDRLFFDSSDEFTAFKKNLSRAGHIDHYVGKAITFENKRIPMSISGNSITYKQSNDFFVFYLTEKASAENDNILSHEQQLSSIINATFVADNVDISIQTALSLAGQYVDVSRVYIFEEISATVTRNTYEWCAEGIEPAIQDLQDLEKEDYNYDVIVNAGMYVTDDVRLLPDDDREILEVQNIKALAIIPFYDHGKPLGYVGFDDCEKYRKWSHSEMQFLQSISVLLAALVSRRNAETGARLSQNVLQTISDNSDDAVYVNTIDTYEIKFVSRALAQNFGKPAEYFIEKTCWQEFQKNQTGPCAFCPIPHITMQPGAERSETYIGEYQNTITHKTFITRDTIVRWVDGELVHIETATDISARKEYEEQLQHIASTDIMTDVFNREWGGSVFESKLTYDKSSGSLCFIDIDGLKSTNDHYGHAAGDNLLIETIKIIKEHISSGDFLCRWGGDEFLLWLGLPPQDADKLISKIQQSLMEYNKTHNLPYDLSFSYGIVAFEPDKNISFDLLVTQADELMYQTKMAKRGFVMKRRRND